MTEIEGTAPRIAHEIGIEKGVEREIRIARVLGTKCVTVASPTIESGAMLNQRYEKLTNFDSSMLKD